jgi:hypothetical protein
MPVSRVVIPLLPHGFAKQSDNLTTSPRRFILPLSTIQIKNIVCLQRRVKELTAGRADERTISAAYELLGSAISDYSPALAALSAWWQESTR